MKSHHKGQNTLLKKKNGNTHTHTLCELWCLICYYSCFIFFHGGDRIDSNTLRLVVALLISASVIILCLLCNYFALPPRHCLPRRLFQCWRSVSPWQRTRWRSVSCINLRFSRMCEHQERGSGRRVREQIDHLSVPLEDDLAHAECFVLLNPTAVECGCVCVGIYGYVWVWFRMSTMVVHLRGQRVNQVVAEVSYCAPVCLYCQHVFSTSFLTSKRHPAVQPSRHLICVCVCVCVCV